MKCKVFYSWERGCDFIEDNINLWLKENPSIIIKFVSQSYSQENHMAISIFYEN